MSNSDWIKATELPKAKSQFTHSERFLLWYEGGEAKTSKFGIGYYHYDPPYGESQWIDFDNMDRVPSFYHQLPKPPTP